MPNWTCHGCNAQSSGGMRQCPQCNKILCYHCSGGKSQCKDSPKGKAGCNGYFKTL